MYYPPISDVTKIAPDQVRLGEHTDWGTFAFNFQVKYYDHLDLLNGCDFGCASTMILKIR